MEQKGYRLPDGRFLVVHPGLGRGFFMTMIVKPNGSMHRLNTSMLPYRATLAQAQADLDFYARQKGLEAIMVTVREINRAVQI